MGNLQALRCEHPAVFGNEFDARKSFRDSSFTSLSGITDFLNCSRSALAHDHTISRRLEWTKHRANFLQAHLRDRSRNTLLEYELVLDALVEQVEELVRREMKEDTLGTCSSSISDDVISALQNPMDDSPDDTIPPRVSSLKAASVVTRASVATVLTGNKNSTVRKRQAFRSCDSPHMKGDNHFELQDDLRKSIAVAIRSAAGKVVIHDDRICGIPSLFSPCTISHNVGSVTSSANNALNMIIDDNMLVLHLKMPSSRSYHYYKTKLSRWKPHHPLSIKIERGLETTDLVAPSKMCGAREMFLISEAVQMNRAHRMAPILILANLRRHLQCDYW